MQIVIRDAHQEGAHLYVQFLTNINGTPEGRRALRILRLYLPYSNFDSQGGISSLPLGIDDDARPVNTTPKCQAKMDEWANHHITVEFKEPVVYAYSRGTLEAAGRLQGEKELAAARKAGHRIKVTQHLLLSLPALDFDVERLRNFIPGDVRRCEDDPHRITIEFYLEGRLADVRPWRLLTRLQPRIKNAIV